MSYELLKFAHLIGLTLIAAGLVGVFVSDLRSRQLRDLPLFAESIRSIAVFYDGLVVPGALILLASGAWLIALYHGGWDFLQVPWLAGMVALFAFEFVEGNTVTRVYFLRLRRLTREALQTGRLSPELAAARAEQVPTFTHFLDLPILLVIVMLGALRPDTWLVFGIGAAVALMVAFVLTMVVPRLYPWAPDAGSMAAPGPHGGTV
jgi:uncharacterized membrane protein